MRILVPIPVKPIVLVWALLSAMILVGFIVSSVVQGKDGGATRSAVTRSADGKPDSVHAGQRGKHSQQTRTPDR